MADCKALEAAVEQIAQLAADLRVSRRAADNLSAQLAEANRIADHQSRELVRLTKHHQDFIVALVKSKCAGRPSSAVIDDLIYDAYESDVVVSLQRLAVGESLMFRDTRIIPQRATSLASSQDTPS